jgi:hypothetical protein
MAKRFGSLFKTQTKDLEKKFGLPNEIVIASHA